MSPDNSGISCLQDRNLVLVVDDDPGLLQQLLQLHAYEPVLFSSAETFKNLRFTGGNDDRFPEFARDLARLNARMILANTPAGVRAAQRLDPPMPVVMVIMNDPVGAGLVASLAHSGNHTTGTANLNEDVTSKVLEFLREIVPKARVLAVLFNPLNPTNPVILENLRSRQIPSELRCCPLR